MRRKSVTNGRNVSIATNRVEADAADLFTFRFPLRVRWSELDPQGVVFNPNYLTYFDVAFGEYLRAIGFPYPQGFAEFGVDTFAVNANVDFKGSARLDDDLLIGARTAYIGRTSLRIAFQITRDGAVLTEGVTVYVVGDRTTQAPQPVPGAFIDRVLAFERTAPERK